MAVPASRAEAFVYCWTDHQHSMLYVGVHKGCQNDGYISSSKVFNEQYEKRKPDFTRQIISTGLFKDMIKLESNILKSVNAAKSPEFYNKSNSDGSFYCSGHSTMTKNKMSNTWKNKTKWNCDNKKAIAAWKGNCHKDESKMLMKESQKRHSKTRSTKMKISNPMKNPESIAKMLETRKLNKEVRNGNT